MINPTEINTKLMTEVTSATTTSARDEAGEGSDSEQRGKLFMIDSINLWNGSLP